MTLAPTPLHGGHSPRLRGLALVVALALVVVAILLLVGHDIPQAI